MGGMNPDVLLQNRWLEMMILHLQVKINRRDDFEFSHHKEMLSIWGDGYTKHPDLIIPQVRTYPNTALRLHICTVFMCQFISNENIKILGM
jgi:hypothetical protein